MDDIIDSSYILEEIQRLTTPRNKNNFDEYFAKVLPKAQFHEPFRKDYNYSYVSRYTLKNNEKNKNILERRINKKKSVPKKLCINSYSISNENINSPKPNFSLKSRQKEFETYISLIENSPNDIKPIKQQNKSLASSDLSISKYTEKKDIIAKEKQKEFNKVSDNYVNLYESTIIPRVSAQSKKVARKTVPVNNIMQRKISPPKINKSENLELHQENEIKEKMINRESILKNTQMNNNNINFITKNLSNSDHDKNLKNLDDEDLNEFDNSHFNFHDKHGKDYSGKILNLKIIKNNKSENNYSINSLVDKSILGEKINKKEIINYLTKEEPKINPSRKEKIIDDDDPTLIYNEKKIIPKNRKSHVEEEEENKYNYLNSNYKKHSDSKNLNKLLRKVNQSPPKKLNIINLDDAHNNPKNSVNDLGSLIKLNFKPSQIQKSNEDFCLDKFLDNFSKKPKPIENTIRENEIPFIKNNKHIVLDNQFLPNKEEKIININNNFNFNQNNIIIKEEIPQCLNCQWHFPKNFTINEKNAHMDHCFEGNGKQDKENYISSITEVNKINEENPLKQNNIEDNFECFICKKYRNTSMTILQKHVNDCIDEEDSKSKLTGKKRNHYKTDNYDPNDYDNNRTFFKNKPF